MLEWFEKHAPIRVKFKVLLALHCTIAILALIAVLIAGGGTVPILMALAGLVATASVQLFAARTICTGYVNTVVRMEGLAAGDTASPIHYTEYRDCVGRMTKAMAAFRENAEVVKAAKDTQDKVVADLGQALDELARGALDYELSEPLPGAYEQLRVNFNATVKSLRETMISVSQAAASVTSGAGEIRAASDDLSLRNEKQAASIEATSAAMNEVTQSITKTADNAADIQNSISSAHREATEGGEVVQRAIEAMVQIEQSAQQIAQIIGVIDGIAFQTNLLALNAGVEAARAGDAGKGFAVVANEVRALAQRSADAARDIKELITTSSQQVEGGVELVGETGSLLGKIVTRVGEISELVHAMAESAAMQAGNLNKVNSAVGDMDRMTQQNAAMVEQSTASARSLADEASGLLRLVSQFRTGDSAAASAPVLSLPPRRKRAALPPVAGNLALKPVAGDDWAEF